MNCRMTIGFKKDHMLYPNGFSNHLITIRDVYHYPHTQAIGFLEQHSHTQTVNILQMQSKI